MVGPDEGSISTGVVIDGRYRLDERIAGGGMGEVWKATDTVLGRTVALKLLRPEYAEDGEFRERLRREARAASAISHVGVVPVFDFGVVQRDDAPPVSYLVMEFVDGLTLSAEVAAMGPLGAERTMLILEQTALGLQAAHEAGVIHRDIKPGNIIVTPQGDVKLTDFGISHASDVVPLTRTGALTGTARYLSPEQARGQAGTAASDIYSLGVVAYACLTGDVPFREGSDIAIALAHVEQPPADLPRDVPAGLRNLIMSMLSKRPADRPESAAAVAAAVRALRQLDPDTRDDLHPFPPATMADELQHVDPVAPTAISDAIVPGIAADAVLDSTGPMNATAIDGIVDRTAVVPVLDEPLGDSRSTTGQQPVVEPSRRNRRRLVIGGILILLVLTGVAFALVHSQSGGTRVPDVVGKQLDAAKSAMSGVGLRTKVVTVDEPKTEQGIVVKQGADADSRVDPGSTVTLSVASGKVDIPVDQLVGSTYDEASSILDGLGLKASKRTKISSDERGTVIAVNPENKAAVGSTVLLTVAGGSSDDDKEDKGKKDKNGKNGDRGSPTTTAPPTTEPPETDPPETDPPADEP